MPENPIKYCCACWEFRTTNMSGLHVPCKTGDCGHLQCVDRTPVASTGCSNHITPNPATTGEWPLASTMVASNPRNLLHQQLAGCRSWHGLYTSLADRTGNCGGCSVTDTTTLLATRVAKHETAAVLDCTWVSYTVDTHHSQKNRQQATHSNHHLPRAIIHRLSMSGQLHAWILSQCFYIVAQGVNTPDIMACVLGSTLKTNC